ncbi:Monoogygenase [Colletotrichum viniferum]|nr:Monoogygenase [Colletotrichum viniferum]
MAPEEIQKLAFFGCTGSTSSAVLISLLSNTNKSTKIHVFVRSARKLKLLFPGIESYSHVEITEGQLSDHVLMEHCLSGATHIMCTIGSNDNQPGMRMHRDAVEAILAVLSKLHEKADVRGTWRRPHMTFLSSESISEMLSSHRPAWVHWLIMASLNHIYFDLDTVEKKLISVVAGHGHLVPRPFSFRGGVFGLYDQHRRAGCISIIWRLGHGDGGDGLLACGSERSGRYRGESQADGPRPQVSAAGPETHQWNFGSFCSWLLEPARIKLISFRTTVMKVRLAEKVVKTFGNLVLYVKSRRSSQCRSRYLQFLAVVISKASAAIGREYR